MNIQRLIALNTYTPHMIWQCGGNYNPDIPTIIYVGNSLVVKKVENMLLNDEKIELTAPPASGKLTLILSICQKQRLYVRISYDGKDLGEDDGESVYIFRNPEKKTNTNYTHVVLLWDEPHKGAIPIFPPTDKEKTEYERLKGLPFPYITPQKQIQTEMVEVAKILSGQGSPDVLPEKAVEWIRTNYRDRETLVLCDLAHKVDDDELKWALLNNIRPKYLNSMQFPVWNKKQKKNV